VDTLAEVGILRTHRITTELAATLARRLRCLARYERNTISDILKYFCSTMPAFLG
jgi:hypothetical protein